MQKHAQFAIFADAGTDPVFATDDPDEALRYFEAHEEVSLIDGITGEVFCDFTFTAAENRAGVARMRKYRA